MTEFRQALNEINAIRALVARGTEFRGYGPLSIAASGMIALLVATVQSLWFRDSEHDPAVFLVTWIATAAVAVALTTTETIARADTWMLPGLWELIFALGVFASCRFLPRQMLAVGFWYVLAGLVCLMIASGPRTVMPWEMGIPFGVGQLLVAAVLHYGFEETREESR